MTAVIFEHVRLTPEMFVNFGRVCKRWREVCHRDHRLLMKTAKSQAYLTRREFLGLFAIFPEDAKSFPQGFGLRPWHVHNRKFKYSGAAIDAALVGGVVAWRERLEKRAAVQELIETMYTGSVLEAVLDQVIYIGLA